jgi:photoactive yellow protein
MCLKMTHIHRFRRVLGLDTRNRDFEGIALAQSSFLLGTLMLKTNRDELLSDLDLMAFAAIAFADLAAMDTENVDRLPFGVIGLNATGIVDIYNVTEASMAGLERESVIGTHYFLTTAQCMNNFMVAQRFEDEPELDTIIDYVLTFRMRPTPVKLRLLKGAASPRRYILIQR